jgi:aspartate aminotransferase
MTRTLSTKIRNVEESQTLAIGAKAKRMKDAGIDVAILTTGEPDFPTPRHIKEAAIKAIEANFTKYTANAGTPELLDAIIKKFSNDNDLHFERDHIVVSCGAKHSIYNVLQAICNKGDEVVFFAPYWVSYPEMVKMADATPVIVKTTAEEQFKPNVQKLQRAINARTKALIINSPSNPSGVVCTRSELEEIADIVRRTRIFVISDEIYEKVMYDGKKHFSIGSTKEIRDQVITINGVSKAFAMTGWRIGYAGGPLDVMQAAAKVQSQVTSNPNSIAQKATCAALNGSSNDIHTMVEAFTERRDFVFAKLSEMRGVRAMNPGGAFYFLFDVSSFYGKRFRDQLVTNSATMGTYLLDTHRVATIPGIAFGDDDCLRLSYACSMSELEKGLARIKEGLEALS